MGQSRTPSKPTACALIAALLLASPARSFAASPDDPLEPLNRGLYAVHRALDAVVFGPAGRAYKAVLPAKMRKGLRNVITNLKEPAIAFNDLLQAHPSRAGRTAARFVINSTAGVGGLMDIAYDAGLPHHDNGFGATAGRYGVQPGPYLFVPFIGPTSFRDLFGQVADMVTDPMAWQPFRNGEVIWARAIIDGLDQRAEADEQLKAIDRMSTDPYASLRSLYQQNRAAQINEAITGMPGSAEPVFEEFDTFDTPGDASGDTSGAPADPAAPEAPAPGTDPDRPPAVPSEPRPVTLLEDRAIEALLARPLAPVRGRDLPAPRVAPAYASVESPRAG